MFNKLGELISCQRVLILKTNGYGFYMVDHSRCRGRLAGR